MKDIAKVIGTRIKMLRFAKHMQQTELAKRMGISQTHMSNIETGTTKVSLTTIVTIANALQVTVDDLLCDNVIHSKVQFQKDVAVLLESCDDYEIRVVKDTVTALLDSLRRGNNLKKQTYTK